MSFRNTSSLFAQQKYRFYSPGTSFSDLAWPNYANGLCTYTPPPVGAPAQAPIPGGGQFGANGPAPAQAPIPGGGQFGVNGTAPAPAPAGVRNPSCDVDVCFPGTCRLYENGNKCRCPKGFARQTKAPGPFGERREVCVRECANSAWSTDACVSQRPRLTLTAFWSSAELHALLHGLAEDMVWSLVTDLWKLCWG